MMQDMNTETKKVKNLLVLELKQVTASKFI